MYEVGQIVNIGYYGGYKCQSLIKTTAEVISVYDRWIKIKVHLQHNTSRTLFGCENDLKDMENNYYIQTENVLCI